MSQQDKERYKKILKAIDESVKKGELVGPLKDLPPGEKIGALTRLAGMAARRTILGFIPDPRGAMAASRFLGEAERLRRMRGKP